MSFERHETQRIFIGRTNELNYFREYILRPESPTHNIISISGTGGVGKTTLLSQFINVAISPTFKDYCLTAKVDEKQLTPASIMEKFADQLSLKGEFRRTLNHYKEALRRQQSERKKFHDDLLHKVPDFAGAAAEGLPLVGPIVGEGVKVASERLLDGYRNVQIHRDAEQLEDSLGNLTKAFAAEVNRLADGLNTNWKKHRRRIILFFDTFEQLAAEIVPWLLDYFLETNLSNNIVLVIAGRYAIEHSTPDGPRRWLRYHDDQTIHSISLNSFTEVETRAYLDKRSITDPERIDTIWQLSHGLPLYLGLLTSNPEAEVDPTKDVVDNFLRWIPEKEYVKRQLAQNAALFSRPFNQDDLAAFTYLHGNDHHALYRWLTEQPFVQVNPKDGRYVYHELAQELFSRHLFRSSKREYYSTRRALANYYQQLIEEIQMEEGRELYNSAELLELILALGYQLFLLPNEVKHIKAIEQFLYAYEHAEQTEEIIRVLKSLYKEQLMTQMSDEAKKAVWNLLEYIESDQESQNFLVAVSYLIEKVGLELLFSTDMLASMYHARGYTYGVLEEYQRTIQKYNHTEVSVLDYLPALYLERADAYAVIEEYRRAIIDYSNAIKLEPKYALAYIRRGTAYRKLKEYEQAITDLSYALKLEPKNAIAYAERGIAYRLQKKYERGLEDFSCALKLEPRNAIAYLDRGIAYLYIKDLRLAKADFNNSFELDSKNISAHWGSLWSEMCQEAANLKMATRLEVIASLDPDHYVAYVCRSVSLGLRGHLDEALKKLESIIASVPDEWDAYFWKGMVCAALRRDTEALAALEQALVLGLPPILLSPLRWLEKTRPDFYVKCAVPLLTSKGQEKSSSEGNPDKKLQGNSNLGEKVTSPTHTASHPPTSPSP